jgi:hypothetical protein
LSLTTDNTDDHSVSFGMGDITLGDKTTAQGASAAVAVGGSTHGDIVSGDGAVLGNGDTSAGGDVVSAHGGNVIQTWDTAAPRSRTAPPKPNL